MLPQPVVPGSARARACVRQRRGVGGLRDRAARGARPRRRCWSARRRAGRSRRSRSPARSPRSSSPRPRRRDRWRDALEAAFAARRTRSPPYRAAARAGLEPYRPEASVARLATRCCRPCSASSGARRRSSPRERIDLDAVGLVIDGPALGTHARRKLGIRRQAAQRVRDPIGVRADRPATRCAPRSPRHRRRRRSCGCRRSGGRPRRPRGPRPRTARRRWPAHTRRPRHTSSGSWSGGTWPRKRTVAPATCAHCLSWSSRSPFPTISSSPGHSAPSERHDQTLRSSCLGRGARR